MTEPLIAAAGVVKGYRTPAGYVPVLEGVDLEVAPGEMVAIIGASGVGKSTLLHVLGSLDRPEKGRVEIAGQDLFALDEGRLREFRNRTLGFVFQFHHLLPEFTALENVMMPMLIARRPLDEARSRARALLEEMGLSARADHRPGALSGGEQQRVAVARAVVLRPRLVLADEPTGNLDPQTAGEVHQLFHLLNRQLGITLVIATHNESLTRSMGRALRMRDGHLIEESG